MQVGPLAPNIRSGRRRHIDIDTDTNHRGTLPVDLPADVDQDAGQLGPIDQHIVGPFQPGPVDAHAVQATQQADACHQAQSTKRGGPDLGAPQQRQVQIRGKGRDPLAPMAATPAVLHFGKTHRTGQRPGTRLLAKPGIGGVQFREDVDGTQPLPGR